MPQPMPARAGRPAAFVLVAFMQNSRGERAVGYFNDERELEALRGQVPKTMQLVGFRSREDPDLQDRLARFNAGELLPIKRRSSA